MTRQCWPFLAFGEMICPGFFAFWQWLKVIVKHCECMASIIRNHFSQDNSNQVDISKIKVYTSIKSME
jgi:hypothetical protein